MSIRNHKVHIPELLSPAGSAETLHAVINAGADAVYIGGARFGARAYADNPEEDELLSAIDHAHLHGVAVHMTVNTLLKESELPDLIPYVRPYYERGVDAVIVQDLGVMRILHETFPELPIHASTQLSVSGPEGVRLLAEAGASRIVLARELSLSEIEEIKRTAGAEIEVFAHGALCVCMSGRCLMSSLFGGRSGNRGRCAQPCRLPYEGGYLLSPKDLCAAGHLAELSRIGVDSIKIEGRMKKPSYAAGVTAVYRSILDRIADGGDGRPTREEIADLTALFSRDGFTDGYLTGDRNGMIAVDNKKLTEGNPASEAANKRAEERYVLCDRKIPVQAEAVFREGDAASFTYICGSHRGSAEGPVVQKAEKAPVTAEMLEKQLRKLGNTPFCVSECSLDTDGGGFLPVGILSGMRRNAVEDLTSSILSGRYRHMETQSGPRDAAIDEEGVRTDRNGRVRIEALVTDRAQMEAAFGAPGVDAVIAEWSFFADPRKDPASFAQSAGAFASEGKRSGKETYIAFPYILTEKDRYIEAVPFRALTDAGISGFLIRDVETLGAVKRLGLCERCIADSSLYTMNRSSQSFLSSLGIRHDTAPFELSAQELARRRNENSTLPVYGRIPLMVTKQCLFRNAHRCAGNDPRGTIRDRKGVVFPVWSVCGLCYNVIWNSVPLSLLSEWKTVRSLGFGAVRLMFTTETGTETAGIIRDFTDAYRNGRAVSDGRDHTRGHFRRGVE